MNKLLEYTIDAPEADVELLVGDVPSDIVGSEMPLLFIAENRQHFILGTVARNPTLRSSSATSKGMSSFLLTTDPAKCPIERLLSLVRVGVDSNSHRVRLSRLADINRTTTLSRDPIYKAFRARTVPIRSLRIAQAPMSPLSPRANYGENHRFEQVTSPR